MNVNAAIAPVHFSRRFNALPSLADFGSVELTPGLNITSDVDNGTYQRAMFNPTLAHPACMASMLPEEHCGVVGPDLKVYGVGKLSVIDANVIPYLPATHLCTTVYGIAEKAADLVKERSSWAK